MAEHVVERKIWVSRFKENERRVKRGLLLTQIKSGKRFVALRFTYGISRASYFRLKAGIKTNGLTAQLKKRAGRKPTLDQSFLNILIKNLTIFLYKTGK